MVAAGTDATAQSNAIKSFASSIDGVPETTKQNHITNVNSVIADFSTYTDSALRDWWSSVNVGFLSDPSAVDNYNFALQWMG